MVASIATLPYGESEARGVKPVGLRAWALRACDERIETLGSLARGERVTCFNRIDERGPLTERAFIGKR